VSEDDDVAGGIVEESVGRWECGAETDCFRTSVREMNWELDGEIKTRMGNSIRIKTYSQRLQIILGIGLLDHISCNKSLHITSNYHNVTT
jgi:hypothetical protein